MYVKMFHSRLYIVIRSRSLASNYSILKSEAGYRKSCNNGENMYRYIPPKFNNGVQPCSVIFFSKQNNKLDTFSKISFLKNIE